MKFMAVLLMTPVLACNISVMASSWEFHGPSLPPPGMPPAYHPLKQHHYQGPDRTITWRKWQQVAAYDVRVRTGDRYLGGENWDHYLGFELAPSSQQIIRAEFIHLGEEKAPDLELSPRVRDAIVEIENHRMSARKGAWGWTLQRIVAATR